MAFRPNYKQARGDRDRAKEQKKQEKLRRREEDAAQRKAERGEGDPPAEDDADPARPADARRRRVRNADMAKMKSRTESSVVLFDVFYEDGSRASNRKVPATELGGLDGDDPALHLSSTEPGTEDRRALRQAGRG